MWRSRVKLMARAAVMKAVAGVAVVATTVAAQRWWRWRAVERVVAKASAVKEVRWCGDGGEEAAVESVEEVKVAAKVEEAIARGTRGGDDGGENGVSRAGGSMPSMPDIDATAYVRAE